MTEFKFDDLARRAGDLSRKAQALKTDMEAVLQPVPRGTHPQEKQAMSMRTGVQGIAKVCHDANRSYCETLGDSSQSSWDHAPTWQRKSAENGVLAIMDDPAITPQHLHEKWWAEKKEQGWIYGSVKDVDKKLHPCCVAYGYLPSEQRVKDALFRAIATALLE